MKRFRHIAIAACALCMTLAITGSGWGEELSEDPGVQRLFEELAAFEHAPCETTLYFSYFRGEWWVTCPDCGAIPARNLYPQSIIREVEEWAVNNRLSMEMLLVTAGECPFEW